MPNTLTLSKFDRSGVDIAGIFDALEQGLMSADASTMDLTEPEGTAVLTMAGSTMEMHIDYVTIDGEVHATGFEVLSPTPNGVEIHLTATFHAPEPLGFATWSAASTDDLFDALLGDTRIDLRGSKGDDAAYGSAFGDRMRLDAGDDSAAGGAGDDRLEGGKGLDLLVGGDGDDQLKGGKDADMLIAGPGNDTIKGDGGNDILVMDGGGNVATGGQGNDLFIVSGVSTTAGTSPDNVRADVQDFGSGDVLVITGVQTTMDGNPEGVTLADIENGTVDEFQWRQTKDGVEIQAGDAVIRLSGVRADEVDLDQILFTEQTAAEATELFDTGSGGGGLGTTGTGDNVYVEEMPSGYQKIIWTAQGTEIETWGGDTTGFAGFGAETTV